MARRTSFQDEEQSDVQSLDSDSLIQHERWHFTISEVWCEFPQISRTVLCNTITVSLGCHKCLQDGFQNAHRDAQNADNGSALSF
jgi:hypothetical protein